MQERLRLWKLKKAKEGTGAHDNTTSNTTKASYVVENMAPLSKEEKKLVECNDQDTASASGYEGAVENSNPNCKDGQYTRSHSMSYSLGQKSDLFGSIESSSSGLCKSGPTTAFAARPGAGTRTSTANKGSSRRKTLGSIHEIVPTVKPTPPPPGAALASNSSKGKKAAGERRASSDASAPAACSANSLAHYALPVNRVHSAGNSSSTGNSTGNSNSSKCSKEGSTRSKRRKSAGACTAPWKPAPEHAHASTEIGSGADVDAKATAEALAASECALRAAQILAEGLATQLSDTQRALQRAQEAEKAALLSRVAAEEKAERCWNEVSAQFFINSVNEQRLEEMEVKMSHDRMNQNEDGREAKRKHKIQIKKLLEEKTEFEEQAGTMIGELNEQMNSIQGMCRLRAPRNSCNIV